MSQIGRLPRRPTVPEAQLISLYQDGCSMKELASLANIDQRQVLKLIAGSGVPVRTQREQVLLHNRKSRGDPAGLEGGIPSENVLLHLYVHRQMSSTEIAARFLVHPVTVQRWLKEHNIPVRTRASAIRLAAARGAYRTRSRRKDDLRAAEIVRANYQQWRVNHPEQAREACRKGGRAAGQERHTGFWVDCSFCGTNVYRTLTQLDRHPISYCSRRCAALSRWGATKETDRQTERLAIELKSRYERGQPLGWEQAEQLKRELGIPRANVDTAVDLALPVITPGRDSG